MTERCSSYQPLRCNLFELTENEKRVLGLMLAGLSRGEIAVESGVKPESVGSYKRQIREKLGAASDAEAIEIARQRGLVNQQELGR